MITKIGPHTLHQGDAYAIRATLGWHDADVFDPPYLINATGAGHYRKKRPNFDRMVQQDLHKGFDLGIINPLLCGAAVVFASNNQLAQLLSHMAGSFDRHALCIWQKTNPQPIANKHYRSDCEFYVHAWNKGWHPEGDIGQRLRVRRFTSPRGADRHDHPTCKPLALMDSIMANVAGTTVCDAFMGSGTTGVAAIRAGKIFTGIEQNPDHYATAVVRVTAAWELAQRAAA